MGQGLAFSAHWFFKERFAPFARFGISNGIGENTFYKRDIQVGHGFLMRTYDMLGTSFSMAETAIPGAITQYTAEVFYRFVMTAHLEFTPRIQYIANPSTNPAADQVFYFGIRGRATF